MTRLERRCARLARAYPNPRRAAEVAATLADANAGRRAPRVGDAADVLWHGLVARLGSTAAGTRFGAWGDAAAVAVVLAVLMQAATAVAVATRVFVRTEPPYREHPLGWDRHLLVFGNGGEAAAVVAAALVAATAATAICLGRVGAARALTALAAAGAVATVAASRAAGEHQSFTSSTGMAVALAGAVVGVAVVGTGAVARALRAVPGGWLPVAAVASLGAALVAVHAGPHPFGFGRAGVVAAAYVVQGCALLGAALVVGRESPAAFAGAALVAAPAMPALPVMYAGNVYGGWTLGQVAVTGAVGWSAAALVAWRLARRGQSAG